MTSLQNHLRQLSGNKQNKKVAFKEGDFFLFLFLVLQEITYFHVKGTERSVYKALCPKIG